MPDYCERAIDDAVTTIRLTDHEPVRCPFCWNYTKHPLSKFNACEICVADDKIAISLNLKRKEPRDE